jgi:hypothetical protein
MMLTASNRASENARGFAIIAAELELWHDMKGEGMTTPQKRLARMRESFAKNKSVLTADYKYFTTPDNPAKPHKQRKWRARKCQPNR